ncbi:leucyl aminopeptidase family protein [Pseudomaricurvus alkylphenolicus]|uniref:leucyl aminopeptidase family protein n=1 Tax=Pseudomaricurvus alkylphenolicus TaxID=1306991 RepID=UPI00141E6EBA|nr:leucyl aminopeptidase family protein [Pseudomaricurvus alkylphenolicus]NIB42471.1 leucyl aminopeptidase family protein [Pseudomaricurvus alkylphenolicus]
MSIPELILERNPDALIQCNYDAAIILSTKLGCSVSDALNAELLSFADVDARLGQELVLMHSNLACGGRLLHVPLSGLERDWSDVRDIGVIAARAVRLAIRSGATRPLLVLEGVSDQRRFRRALEVCYLGICHALWQPSPVGPTATDMTRGPLQALAVFSNDEQLDTEFLQQLESGRQLTRDLTAGDPENFAPAGFVEHCRASINQIDIEVIENQQTIARQYPLLAAVARASQAVKRHQPRVVRMEYRPKGPADTTLFLVGKGVTYDTGGADLKVSGAMAGMSCDKGGAAAVAGLMQTIALRQPTGLRVVALLGLVRNSIGADAFVTDEVITARSGKRVLIGNTDAEGRLVMADLLAEAREMANEAVNPQILTLATLTGHAARTYGPYSALIQNETARRQSLGQDLGEIADLWGEGIELSRPRKEDWAFVQSDSPAYDLCSSNNAPSVNTERGHQYPMAFLSQVSGLDQHGVNSEKPISYIHLDLSGSVVEGGISGRLGTPTANPLVTLAAKYLL